MDDSLEYAITWNASALQGQDLGLAAAAMLQKEKPVFEDLPVPKAKL